MARFDCYPVDPVDEMLAEGGRVSPVRFDPSGFEDCAREWEPCECHGDRLCRLGQKMRWYRTSAEHLAWLRGEKETPTGEQLLRMAGCKEQRELDLRIDSTKRSVRLFWDEMWPLLLTCAAEERSWQYERKYFDQVEREQERAWA